MQRQPGRNRRRKEVLVMSFALAVLTSVLTLISPITATPANSATTYSLPNGRLFASNCMQCHGTNGLNGGFEAIAGKRSSEMFSELKEQQGKNSIMGSQARGYTDAELQAISDYFATVKKP